MYIWGNHECYEISKNGTRPLPEKVQAIQQFERPKTVKGLRRLLSMQNVYRRFLPHTARTQVPLHDLMKGDKQGNKTIKWTPLALEAFDRCKEELANATRLAHPSTLPLVLMVNASNSSIGAPLNQIRQD